MKKINFSFLVPHFSPIIEKLKKNEKREFLIFVQPIATSTNNRLLKSQLCNDTVRCGEVLRVVLLLLGFSQPDG